MAKHQPQLRPASSAETTETSTASGKEGSTPTEPEKIATGGCWGRCICYTAQRAQRRSLADDWAAMKVALRCPIVYCSGVWRCLYAMAVYGLQVGGCGHAGGL